MEQMRYTQNIILGGLCALILIPFGLSFLISAFSTGGTIFNLHFFYYITPGLSTTFIGLAFLFFAVAKYVRQAGESRKKQADSLRDFGKILIYMGVGFGLIGFILKLTTIL
jgi:hypothetical protein